MIIEKDYFDNKLTLKRIIKNDIMKFYVNDEEVSEEQYSNLYMELLFKNLKDYIEPIEIDGQQILKLSDKIVLN